MDTDFDFSTDRFPPPAVPRPLISADAHSGAPKGELDKVLSRVKDGEAVYPIILPPETGGGVKVTPAIEPEARLKDMDRDGVIAEVIFGMTGFEESEDFGDAVARIQSVNDWTVETYGGHLDRFAPCIELPLPVEGYKKGWKPIDVQLKHIEAAAAELRRCAALGLRPALLPDRLPGFGYNRPEWDPIWETACEIDIPVAFHVGIGHSPVQVGGPGGAITNYALVTGGIVETVSHLAAGGVLERYPDLRCVIGESGSGWLAWAMGIMDEAHVKHKHWAKPNLPLPPSEYVKRQVQVTFQYDPVGVANRHITGLRCLLWGADYPHHEGTWPNSQGAVEKLFDGVPEDEIRQMTLTNAAETFGFKVPELTAQS